MRIVLTAMKHAPLVGHKEISMTTPADLRAEIARQQISIYRLAAEIGVHPGRLGGYLNGRLPLSRELAERVLAALRREQLETVNGHGA